MAEQAYYKGEGGGVYLMDLPLPEHMQDQVRKGQLVQVADEDGTPLEVVVPPKRPSRKAD